MNEIDVAIVGAGQAGLSLSHCLTRRGIEHVVLERGRIGESWRSERWSSFRLVTPNWSVRLAGRAYNGSLASGAVLVVGSAQSGCQLADELNRAGRQVYLATGRTGRLPRRYRGRDIIAWQRDMGFLDRSADDLQSPAMRFRPDPHLSGQDGGRTLDLRVLSEQGVTLTGRIEDASGGSVSFADDLASNLVSADDFAAQVVRDVDTYIHKQTLDAPTPDEANSDLGYCGKRFVPAAPAALNLKAQGIGTVLWARVPA